MKSKQNYIDIYRGITNGLNITGEGAELLIQLLAEATYISEVEQVTISQESSLEKCTLMNSKIQHCMNDMYSVYRGNCPRVILRFRPTSYFDLKPFDTIAVGNNYKVYYLGYWTGSEGGESKSSETDYIPLMDGFVYGPKIIPPSISGSESEVYTIIGILAQTEYRQTFKTDFQNTYYVECTEEDLSCDMWVKIEDQYVSVTRIFADHIMNRSVFDMTIPSFGSRLYLADILRTGKVSRDSVISQENVNVEACWYKYSYLSSYPENELRRINIKGAVLVPFEDNMFHGIQELTTGVVTIEESSRDTISTIHYKANRDRYVNSIIRTNSDIGNILEETYPENIKIGGTSYKFNSSITGSSLVLYYVPQDINNLLTSDQVEDFRQTKSGYYVTDNITILPGTKYTAVFNLDVILYQSGSIDSEVSDILLQYEDKFNIDFRSLGGEIQSLVSKISNVKEISSFSIDYISDNGIIKSQEELDDMYDNLYMSYYKVNYVINSSIVQSTGKF